MSGNQWYPPPGDGTEPPRPPGWAPAPATPQPTWAPPPPGTPPPGMLGAAHKPGALPLRPLALGDMFDAAFRIIRFNPKATVGSAVLVAAIAMALPVLVTAVLTAAVDFGFDQSDPSVSTSEAVALTGSFGALALGSILQAAGLILVTGMIAHVTAAAAIGRRLSLGEAWTATRGKRWRLIGLAALLALMTAAILAGYGVAWLLALALLPTEAAVGLGLVSVPFFLGFLCWFWIRVYYLPVPALMLEQVGVGGAIARGFRLTRRQFWRTFGIALLTLLVSSIAGSMLGAPLSIGAQVAPLAMGDSRFTMLVVTVLLALGTVVQTAFVTPFAGAVTSVQYLDQRMRKEAYDVELMAQAGITAP